MPAPSREEIDARSKLFQPKILAWFWPFARQEPHGHPPFYALVGLVGDLLAPGCRVLARARLGTMLAFSLTAGAIASFFSRRWGIGPAVMAAGAWVLQPRLFAHGHYAHYDALLTCLWVGAILAFACGVERSPSNLASRSNLKRMGWAIVFGLCVGGAAATKLTGWFLPLPFILWTLIHRDRFGLWMIGVGGLVGVLFLVGSIPPWWHDPIRGLEIFLRSNLSRGQTTRIPTMFLGKVILTPKDSLPWYNTLVWTLFATPVGILAIAIIGAFRSLIDGRIRGFGSLVVLNWWTLLIIRGLPHMPGHDGIRLFLPAFGGLALASGLGAIWILERWQARGRLAAWIALVEGGLGISSTMPVPLSYYSPIVGGLPGATAMGMEPTYYWDALTEDALRRLNARCGPEDKIAFPDSITLWPYLRQEGKLKAGIESYEPGRWAWYVVQNRPGRFGPLERDLIARVGPKFILVQKWGVPLIWAFPFHEVDLSLRRISKA